MSEPPQPIATPPAGSRGPEIVLQNPNRYPEAGARRLGPWVRALVADLAPQADSFAARFVGDRAMRRANRDWRDRDRTTDVLSFPGGHTPDGHHLGDLLVSVPAARRQAAAADWPVVRELRRLILHGVLHCLGYDHETDGGAMERLERRLQRRWLDAMTGEEEAE
ncbi:MAG TPA: rRNA maturation RNase YbeY [Thermoanaerobaculia bacterium]|nr:rRNA maturation RNase YbeY [Thermoanaerobaculia bacterium]